MHLGSSKVESDYQLYIIISDFKVHPHHLQFKDLPIRSLNLWFKHPDRLSVWAIREWVLFIFRIEVVSGVFFRIDHEWPLVAIV